MNYGFVDIYRDIPVDAVLEANSARKGKGKIPLDRLTELLGFDIKGTATVEELSAMTGMHTGDTWAVSDSGTSGGTSFNDLKAAYNSGNTIFAVRSLLNGMSNTLFNLESVIKDGNGVVTSFRFVALHIGDTTNNGDLEVWSRNSSSWMYISSMVREANSAIFAKDYLTGQGGTIESELKARTTIASSTTEVAKAVGASAGSVISVILGSNYGGATSGSTATVENVLKFYVKDDFNAVNGQFYAILRNGGSVTTLTCSSGSQTISDGKFVMVMCLKVGSTVTYHFKE